MSGILTAGLPSQGMTVPVTDLPFAECYLIGNSGSNTRLLHRTIQRQLSPKPTFHPEAASGAIGQEPADHEAPGARQLDAHCGQ
jgi:hypothetical protein